MRSGSVSLPSNTRLLHIGPHKSGTTAAQGAFHLARERLREHGVTYIGKGRHLVKPVQAVTGRPPMIGEEKAGDDAWDSVLAEVAATGDELALLSSEFFAEADEAAARRIVSDLDRDRVHVVATLRPLGKVLAAQWQQYVQAGMHIPYGEWLDTMFNRPHERPNSTFWRRHHQAELIRRWAEAVGPENLTTIVVDDSDKGMLLRTFESLLNLPEEFLVPDDTQANRSLSYGEAEMVRHFNQRFKSKKVPQKLYGSHIRRGAVREMKVAYQPPRDTSGIPTPEWALERAAKLGTEAAETISGLGVGVIGDLELLSQVPRDRVGEPDPGVALAPKAAAEALLGAVAASEGSAKQDKKPASLRDRAVREVPARDLLREVMARGVRRARKPGSRK